MVALALNAVVTLKNQISPHLAILQVVADGWEQPTFVPGQFLSLGLFGSAKRYAAAEAESASPAPGKLICRAYSIASPSFIREFLEFYIALVPTGTLSPRLFNLEIGNRIWLSKKAAGHFTFDGVPDSANLVLIANGTGLAPFMSMLGTHLKLATGRRVALIHGVRNSRDLGYRSTLMAMQHLRSTFCYVPVVSRPAQEPVPWKGAMGHVQDIWQGGVLEQAWGFRPSPQDTHVFLCGSPQMIASMTALLAQEGFAESTSLSQGQVHSEKYWKVASAPPKNGDVPSNSEATVGRGSNAQETGD